MSEKEHSKPETFITIVGFILLFFVVIIIGSYICKFGAYNFSNDANKWGVFGDYMGGTLNALFGLANLVVLTYITLKITRIEERRNENNYKNSVFPAFCVSTSINPNLLNVNIESFGLGAVIIKSIKIKTAAGDEFDGFFDFFSSQSSTLIGPGDIEITTTKIKDKPIQVDHKIQIISMNFATPSTAAYYTLSESLFVILKQRLGSCTLTIEYTDIFEKNIYTKIENVEVPTH